MGKRHGTKRKSQTNTVCKNIEENVAQVDNEEMTPLKNQDQDKILKNKKLKAECKNKDSECKNIPTSVDGSSVAMETDNTDSLPNPLKCGLTTLKVIAQKALDKYKGVNIGVNACGHQDVSPVKISTTQFQCRGETTQPDMNSVDVVSNTRKQLIPESTGGLDLNQNKTSSTTSAQDNNAAGSTSSGADCFASTSNVKLMEEEAVAISCEEKKTDRQKSEAGGSETRDMEQEAALSKDGAAEKGHEENCLDNCMASLEEFAGMIGDLSDSQLCNMDEDHTEGANKNEAGDGLEHQGQGDCSKEVGQSAEKSAGVSAYDIESLMIKLTADLTGINAMVTRYRREIALTKQKCLRLQKNQLFHKQNKLK